MFESPIHVSPELEQRKRRRHFRRFKEMLGEKAFLSPSDLPETALFETGRSQPELRGFERDVAHHLVSTLIIESQPAVLELVTGDQSLVPPSVQADTHVGLGPSEAALERNSRLTERVAHAVNQEGRLPFEDERFDVVIHGFAVPYVEDAARLFAEAGRVLKPGGLLMVLWGERFDPELAIRYWRAADDDERMLLVEESISQSGRFGAPRIFQHPAPPRAEDGGEVSLVYAERRGADPRRALRPFPAVLFEQRFSPAQVEQRKRQVAQTQECPYCAEHLERVEVDPSPWGGWDAEALYVCMNDTCPHLLGSYSTLYEQGIRKYTYRATFLPETGQMISLPTPVQGDQILPRRLTKDH
jgi:SAM-dependent methyltransferase